jgi:hypothetical protein
MPTVVTITASLALLVHGPILQFADYHAFADQRAWLGVPRAGDVLSNAGFAIVGLWGLTMWWRNRRRIDVEPGHLLFLVALVLTAVGSAIYHLSPGDARLVWDRLPIALGCAGLLASVRAGTRGGSARTAVALGVAAVASVLWWRITNGTGEGDLRPYLLLQGLPLVLIPLWQAIYGAPRSHRLAFGLAIVLYVAAKMAELHDRDVFELTGCISGHTIKHLLATVAAATIVRSLGGSRSVAEPSAALHDLHDMS